MQISPLLTLLSLALTLPSALAGDTLTRVICHCSMSNYNRYAHIFTYTNGRTGETFNAGKVCGAEMNAINRCPEDYFYGPSVRTCSEDERFCYNEEYFTKNKYSFDGKEASVGHAGEPEPSEMDCNEACKMVMTGFTGGIGGTMEVYRDIEPGL
ncbi:MAG: hypothetical protein Q9221_008321 [Calogaya cf. arnoldii]